jgi:hypothetical protein
MKLSPICWAAAFSAALPCRRALRRGPLAGTGAVPGGGAGGGGGGGAVVATLGGLARGGRARTGGNPQDRLSRSMLRPCALY